MELDDDIPQLSIETFNALQEYYKEQEERETIGILNLANSSEGVVEEDWQLSQFWYDESTTNILIQIILKSIENNGKVALISCPTLYKKLKENINKDGEVTLFEYDRRFGIYGSDYVAYDYKSPLDIPRDKCSYYDLVIADPPFLSDECLTKTAVTMKYLAKNKIILCTGSIMAEMAQRLLDLKKSGFHPKHKNNLANEFWCYSNYDIDKFLT